MPDLRFDARMSDTEALVWGLEDHDARLRSTIAVVAFLERSPGIGSLRTRVERMTRVLPRLRDRVVPGFGGLTPPVWEADPAFDLAFHLRRVQLPSAGGRAAVLRWAEPVVAEGLDRSRPLWQMTLVEQWPDDRAALVLKLHHTFTDGLGAVKLAGVLFDLDADADEAPVMPPLPQAERRSRWGRLSDEVVREVRRGTSVARRAAPAAASGLLAAVADPEPSVLAGGRMIRSVAHLAAPTVRPLSPVLRSRSLRSRFEVVEAPLEALRAAARAGGGTVNDVFVASVLAGLRRYHERHGSWPESLRVGLPISTRRPDTDDEMRNQFVPVRVVAPLQETDPAALLAAVHRLVATQRAEPGLAAADQMAAAVNRLPGLRSLLAASMSSVDVVVSNVAGIDAPLYLRGARVTALVPFGPRNGAALNITMLGYDRTLHLGANLDAVAIPDHDVLVDCLRLGLAETVGT